MLDLASGSYTEPKGGCPRPAFSQLGALHFHPPLLRISSAAKGSCSEQIVLYTPERGQRGRELSVQWVGCPPLFSWIQPDGHGMGFGSPCDLTDPNSPCEPRDDSELRYYVAYKDGSLHETERSSSSKVRYPDAQTYAWVHARSGDTALCIDGPGGTECVEFAPPSNPCLESSETKVDR